MSVHVTKRGADSKQTRKNNSCRFDIIVNVFKPNNSLINALRQSNHAFSQSKYAEPNNTRPKCSNVTKQMHLKITSCF